jgi:pyridoxamine 5'-phosphate oxidase
MNDPNREDPPNIADLRFSYDLGRLDDPSGNPPSWWALLGDWFAQALESGQVGQGNAMQVASVDGQGRPAVRTVLCKGIDERGITFYTNLSSAKGEQLGARPYAEAVFAWVPLERQIRIKGAVVRVSAPETEQYWASRPRGSQIGAWASPQSQVVPNRAWLDDRYAEFESKFAGQEVPLPADWGGLRIVPDEVEFWQGRPDRLHDRLRMRRVAHTWVTERLAP